MIIRHPLIYKVHSTHTVVVVIHEGGYCDGRMWILAPKFIDMGLVESCLARFIPALDDAVPNSTDSAYKKHHSIIHPPCYHCSKLVNHSVELVELNIFASISCS